MLSRNESPLSPVCKNMFIRRGAVRSLGFRILSAALVAALAAISANAQFARNRYTLILEEPAVAERFAGREAIHSAGGETYRAEIQTKQTNLLQELASRNILVTGFGIEFSERRLRGSFARSGGHAEQPARRKGGHAATDL